MTSHLAISAMVLRRRYYQCRQVGLPASARRRLRTMILVGWFTLAILPALAHSPFESSTRAIAMEGTVELALTVGMAGGAELLKDAPRAAFQNRPVGPGLELAKSFAVRWFEVSADGEVLSPTKVLVRTDGLEFNIVVVYPRPPGGLLNLRTPYVEQLPAGFKSSFVLTDENGNIFASRMLKRGDNPFAVTLPGVARSTAGAGDLLPLATNPPLTSAVKSSLASTNFAADKRTTNQPAEANLAIAPTSNARLAFWDFLKLGIEHILTGYDHLLFLCGLLVACRRVGPMLAIITCFTIAHSITLALAALEVVSISPRIIEPLIAMTIVLVGVENFRGRDDVKLRCGLALGFGLIHGFGFAGALRDAGLAGRGLALVKPLFSFNLGVECGQLAVAAVFLPLLFWLRRWPVFSRWGTPAISVAVVLAGSYWLLQRVGLTQGW